MTDPWDDPGRSQSGFVVTAGGLRVPVAAPTSPGGWPATTDAAAGAGLAVSGTEARYRGVGPKGYQRSDPHVREQVCERLLLDPFLDASRVVVKVSKGRVALTGSVPSERMRAAAVAAASSVAAGAVDARLEVAAGGPARARRASAARAPRASAKTAGMRAKSGRKRGGRR